MRIFNGKHGDPMLLDSRVGLRTLHREFAEFLGSGALMRAFEAQTNGSPAPYDEFLKGLRVKKSQEKDSKLYLGTDGWLELSGNEAALAMFGKKLLVLESDTHSHWYGTPVSLIVEADDEWIENQES